MSVTKKGGKRIRGGVRSPILRHPGANFFARVACDLHLCEYSRRRRAAKKDKKKLPDEGKKTGASRGSRQNR